MRVINYTGQYRVIGQFQLEWGDLWIGVLYRALPETQMERPIHHLYICLIPCLPFHLIWGRWQ